MQQLDNIIQKLSNDRYYAVTITNSQTMKPLAVNMTGEKMGDIGIFLNDLVVRQGNNKIAIQPRRQNGSSFKDAGPIEHFDFTPNAQPQPQMQHISPPLHQTHDAVPMNYGLAGVGLSAPEQIYKVMDYPKIAAENIELKAEKKALEKQVADLEKAALQNEFSESKANGNSAMLTGIMTTFGPIVETLLMSKMGGAPAAGVPGLGGTPPQGLSAVKSRLMEIAGTTDDRFCMYLNIIYDAMMVNETFGTELLKLLENHNLITPAAA